MVDRGSGASGGLPIGTRVVRNHRPAGRLPRFGTVMPHEPEHSRGCFPVRFDDCIWETCTVSDVTVVATSSSHQVRAVG